MTLQLHIAKIMSKHINNNSDVFRERLEIVTRLGILIFSYCWIWKKSK